MKIGGLRCVNSTAGFGRSIALTLGLAFVLTSAEPVFAADAIWDYVDASDYTKTKEGEVVTITGNLTGRGDLSVVYVLSDSNRFSLDFESPPPGTGFWVEVFEGNGDSTGMRYSLEKTRHIKPGFVGGFYLKIYSNVGSGGWGLSYKEKEKRLIDFTWKISFKNESGDTDVSRLEVRVPVIKTNPLYQEVVKSSTNIPYKKIDTDNLGNDFYIFEFTDFPANGSLDIVMKYQMVLKSTYSHVKDRTGNSVPGLVKPEPLIESNNPFIINLARRITTGDKTDYGKMTSIYRYILTRIEYQYQDEMVGALKALSSGRGDCNEFTDAVIALARASGIPARKWNGYIYFDDNNIQAHATTEVYLPGVGWSIVDPTMICFVARPPVYIYNYTGENPSFLADPDSEVYVYFYNTNGPKDARVSDEYTITARELP